METPTENQSMVRCARCDMLFTGPRATENYGAHDCHVQLVMAEPDPNRMIYACGYCSNFHTQSMRILNEHIENCFAKQEDDENEVSEAVIALHALCNDAAEACEHALNAIDVLNQFSDSLDTPAVAALRNMRIMMRSAWDLAVATDTQFNDYFQAPE